EVVGETLVCVGGDEAGGGDFGEVQGAVGWAWCDRGGGGGEVVGGGGGGDAGGVVAGEGEDLTGDLGPGGDRSAAGDVVGAIGGAGVEQVGDGAGQLRGEREPAV